MRPADVWIARCRVLCGVCKRGPPSNELKPAVVEGLSFEGRFRSVRVWHVSVKAGVGIDLILSRTSAALDPQTRRCAVFGVWSFHRVKRESCRQALFGAGVSRVPWPRDGAAAALGEQLCSGPGTSSAPVELRTDTLLWKCKFSYSHSWGLFCFISFFPSVLSNSSQFNHSLPSTEMKTLVGCRQEIHNITTCTWHVSWRLLISALSGLATCCIFPCNFQQIFFSSRCSWVNNTLFVRDVCAATEAARDVVTLAGRSGLAWNTFAEENSFSCGWIYRLLESWVENWDFSRRASLCEEMRAQL